MEQQLRAACRREANRGVRPLICRRMSTSLLLVVEGWVLSPMGGGENNSETSATVSQTAPSSATAWISAGGTGLWYRTVQQTSFSVLLLPGFLK